MPVVGVEPTRVISTRDLEFSGGFSIWCHLVPDFKAKSNSTSNEFLTNLRIFVTFPLSSDFSIWIAQMEIGGMFRRDAEPVIQDCAHGLFSFLENISNPCNSEGGSFVSRMKRQNRVYTPAVIHTIRRGDILL